MRKTIEDMVQQEVMCCVSSLVSTLANGSGCVDAHSRNAPRDNAGKALADLCEQAFELAAPVPDYEEAARQKGWRVNVDNDAVFLDADQSQHIYRDGWQELCEANEIEPYDWEVYEFWAVTEWFAARLIEQGEKVDTDFGALNVWARTTTGQAISVDGCIKRIYDAMMQPVEA